MFAQLCKAPLWNIVEARSLLYAPAITLADSCSGYTEFVGSSSIKLFAWVQTLYPTCNQYIRLPANKQDLL